MSTDIQTILSDLERTVSGATKGPWRNGIDDREGIVAPGNTGLGNVICLPPQKNMYSSLERWPDNAAYILSCSPDRIEVLTQYVRGLEAESAALTKALTGLTRGGSEYFIRKGDRFTADIPVCTAEIRERFQRDHQRAVRAILDKKAAERSCEVMRKAASRAERWFRDYERQHRAKGTPEGVLKADTNEERADYLRQALEAASKLEGEGS